MMLHNQAIDAYLEENLDTYIQETALLCKQPSISATGEGIEVCAVLVEQALQEQGFETQKFSTPGNPILVGHADGKSKRTLLFYNHYDVQPPEPLDLWTTLPFEPEIRNGALYGRGSKDDKGELIARLAAVEAVREAHGGQLPCGVTFVVEGEEEIGSPHIAQFVKDHLDLLACQGAIWEEGGVGPDGRPILYLGKRGILYVELSVESMNKDAHSGQGHILPNAAWRLHWALNRLKNEENQVLIPDFYDHVKPPSDRDVQLLEDMPSLEDHLREEFGIREFVGGLNGKDLNRAVFEPTCNLAGITAGYQGKGSKTVIPARASAKIDFRLVPDQDPDDIFAKMRKYLDEEGFSDVKVKRLGSMWPEKTPGDDPLVQLTAQTAGEVYQEASRLVPLSGGSSPVYAFAGPLGNIPVVNPGVGYANNRTHAPDEHVRIEDFHQASRHIARILNGFASLGE